MSRKRKIQIAQCGLLLGILILVSTLALSQATDVKSPRSERKYLLIEQDYGRVNAGEVFIVEYEVSLPLKLDLGAIKETLTTDILNFLEGQHTIYYKDETYEVGIFLNYTHLRLKINSTKVCMISWNLKMYEDGWVNEEIQGTVIFDRIVMTPVITSAWISDYNATDNTYAFGGQFSITLKWNPEEGRWEEISPKEDS